MMKKMETVIVVLMVCVFTALIIIKLLRVAI